MTDQVCISVIAITNDSSSCACADIPGPPEAPLEITELDIDACTLLWNSPQEDGGSNITNYIVEKCDISQGDWVTVSPSCTKTSFRMTKLTPGKEYCFRVRAENRLGISEPIYSEKMIARYPFGELRTNLYIFSFITCNYFYSCDTVY